MAVEKMKIISIIGKYNKLEETIDTYINTGCYQPEQTASLISNVKGFSHISDENPYSTHLQRITEIFTSAGIELNAIETEKIFDEDDIDFKLGILEERLFSLKQNQNKLEDDIAKTELSISQLNHFVGLDVDLANVLHSDFVGYRFGRIPLEYNEKLKDYKNNPFVMFFESAKDKTHVWGMYAYPIAKEEEIDEIFSSLYFEKINIPDVSGIPKQALKTLEIKLLEAKLKHKQLNHIINDFISLQKDEYLALYTQLKRSYETFEVRRFGAKYGDSFILLGWIPEKKLSDFIPCLEKIAAIEYEVEDAGQVNFKPPTVLKNFKLFKPFEYYVNMFGAPSYNEIDPTFFIAITYTIIYGLMFADLGQGIVLAIAGFLMYKFKKMEVGKILIPCGISGAFFGFWFGSVFGYEHVLDPVYRAMGFHEKPIEISNQIMPTLITAILIGTFMLICAILFSIISNFKQKHYEHAIFGENGLAGLAVYVSVILLVACFLVPAMKPFTMVIVLLGLVLPLLLIFMKEPLGKLIEGKKDWQPESWGEFIMQSFFEVFEIFVSYMANTFSFLRIGAFALIHISMMSVFFILSDLAGGGSAGMFIIIFGNIFVLALEGLLVAIQTLRLMFYEVFSRFFSGDGTPFTPAVFTVDKLKEN